MAESLKFVLDLVDRTTGPAKRITKGLELVQKKARELDRSFAKADKAVRGFSEKHRGKLEKTGRAIAALGSGAKVAAIGIAGLAVAGAGLATAGAATAADAVAFRQSTERALEAMLGSKQAANGAMSKILGLSSTLGTNAKDTLSGVKDIMSAGFKLDESIRIFEGAADLKALKPDVDISSIVKNFGQMKALGRATFDEMKEITIGSGLGMDSVVAQLSKTRGKDAKGVMADLSGGKISADEAIAAVLAATSKKTGKALGGFQQGASKSFGGTLDRLKNLPDAFMMRMSVDDGPLTRALDKIVTVLDPESPTGKRAMAFVEKVVGGIANAFEGVSFDDVIGVFDTIGTVIDGVWGTVTGFWDELKIGFTAIIGPTDEFAGGAISLDDALGALKKTAKFLGAAIGVTAGLVVKGVSLVIEAVDWVVGAYKDASNATAKFFRGIVDFFASGPEAMWDTVVDLGKSIVDGIWEGLKKAWVGMLKMFDGLLDLLPDTVKKALGIASPSKVMIPLGMHTVAGFAQGVNAAAPMATNAMASAVAPPTVTASSASARGAGGGGVVLQFGDVNIQGAGTGDARELARDFLREVRREVEVAFDGVALQLGAP